MRPERCCSQRSVGHADSQCGVASTEGLPEHGEGLPEHGEGLPVPAQEAQIWKQEVNGFADLLTEGL